ncbi:hypothetical protein AAF134_11710 [Synechococcus lacustris Tous-12m]
MQQLQTRTRNGLQELKQLEGKVLALRSGDVVLTTGQALTSARMAIPQQRLVKKQPRIYCARQICALLNRYYLASRQIVSCF